MVLRPRGFGKTLMMSTLQSFFEMDYAHPGDTSRQQELFKGLAVTDDRAFCKEHLGRHPVVALLMKNRGAADFSGACAALGEDIWELASRFAWLKDSPRLSEYEKDAFRPLLDREQLCSGAEKSYFRQQISLSLLCGMLRRHCGKRIVLLVDGYDTLLQKAAEHGFFDKAAGVVIPMLGSVIKTNSDIEKAVVTGCLRPAGGYFADALNNLSYNTALSENDSLSEAFGFTEDDVHSLLADCGLGAFYDKVRESYGGYRIGSQEIFCPQEVMSCVSDLLKSGVQDPAVFRPPAYWNNTVNNQIITRRLEPGSTKSDMIRDLLEGRSVEVRTNRITDCGEACKTGRFWNLLVNLGYLTLKKRGKGGVHEFCIPNAEVKACLEDCMKAAAATAATDKTAKA